MAKMSGIRVGLWEFAGRFRGIGRVRAAMLGGRKLRKALTHRVAAG